MRYGLEEGKLDGGLVFFLYNFIYIFHIITICLYWIIYTWSVIIHFVLPPYKKKANKNNRIFIFYINRDKTHKEQRKNITICFTLL